MMSHYLIQAFAEHEKRFSVSAREVHFSVFILFQHNVGSGADGGIMVEKTIPRTLRYQFESNVTWSWRQ